jgi:nucleoid-associated protein YgaU
MGLFDKKDGANPPTAGPPTDQQNLEAKKKKYGSALDAASRNGVRLQDVRWENGKLLIRGEAPSEDAKNKVWDAVKQMNAGSMPQDATVDIKVVAGQGGPAGMATAPAGTYTVKAGDTLSKISKQFYGDANQYMKIFNANKNILKDPDKIQPGQQLTIPPKG